jgi:hypothetical protein
MMPAGHWKFGAAYAARVIGPAVLGIASMREEYLTEDDAGPLYDAQCHINGLLQAKDY